MLARAANKHIKRVVRFYGWEDPKQKLRENFWQYAESDSFSTTTPEQRGYQRLKEEVEADREWSTPPAVNWQTRMGHKGVSSNQMIEMEVDENPLGDYDTNMHNIPVPEIKTRILHVLRHFEKVDLRKLNWEAHLQDELKLDDFERVALLTSIEAEFNLVFEDSVFDNMKKLGDVVGYIHLDRYAI